jgi:hypothetical protein
MEHYSLKVNYLEPFQSVKTEEEINAVPTALANSGF